VLVVAAAAIALVVHDSARTPVLSGGIALVVSGPADGQAAAAWVTDVVDVAAHPARVRAVDPLTHVTLPGTSFDRLRDAYPFGGSNGIADAIRRAEGERPAAFVEITADGLRQLLANDRIELDVPSPMDVFADARVYSFAVGRMQADADETLAVCRGAEYLAKPERERLLGQIGLAAARRLADRGLALERSGQVRTNLPPEEFGRFLREMANAELGD